MFYRFWTGCYGTSCWLVMGSMDGVTEIPDDHYGSFAPLLNVEAVQSWSFGADEAPCINNHSLDGLKVLPSAAPILLGDSPGQDTLDGASAEFGQYSVHAK